MQPRWLPLTCTAWPTSVGLPERSALLSGPQCTFDDSVPLCGSFAATLCALSLVWIKGGPRSNQVTANIAYDINLTGLVQAQNKCTCPLS